MTGGRICATNLVVAKSEGGRQGMTGNRENFNFPMLRRARDRAFDVAAGTSDPGMLPASVVGAVRIGSRSSSAASAPSEPAQFAAAGLLQMAFVAFPGGRGQWPLDTFSRGRGVMHSADGPRPFQSFASPSRAPAMRNGVGPASFELARGRCQLAPSRSPWSAATGQHWGGSGGLGQSPHTSQAARSCSTATAVGANPDTGFAPKLRGQRSTCAHSSGASV